MPLVQENFMDQQEKIVGKDVRIVRSLINVNFTQIYQKQSYTKTYILIAKKMMVTIVTDVFFQIALI